MTALTVYLNQTASSTASTADQLLENASTGGSLSNKNTNLTSGTTGWVTIYAQGNATAQTGAGSQPALADNGWIDDSSTLETNHINSGTWSVALGFETTTTGTFVADFHFRFYQRSSGGTRTLIGEAIASGQTIVSTSYTVLTPSVSASASNTFATGDRLGLDVTINITTNSTTGNLRMQASSSATLGNVNAEVVTPGYSSVTTSTRTIPTSGVLQGTLTRTIPTSAVLQGTLTRTIPTSAVLQGTVTRTIPTGAVLSGNFRAIPTSAVLQSTLTRTIPTSATLTVTSTRTIPTSANLYTPAVFYASNVAQTVGGLTQSDQMSMVLGGTETSFTVTMPSSGTNTYVELLAQGGTSSGTSALPAPTGKGWSIPLQGNTILAGQWYSTFTLAKSGSSMSGATLVVRWYRRTMDGTYYTIGTSTLSSQTFSTTKTAYTTPTVTVNFPWQFIQNDTFYVDAFVFNVGTAWSSDVFTVYVSNSASLGVYNDGITVAPQMITTPAGLTCLVGANSFKTGSGISVKNESFTIADMIDQRSVLTLTGEDASSNISFTPNMPIILSDSIQGKLYDGYLANDQMSKVSAHPSILQREHKLTMVDHHRDYDKEANGILGVNTNGTNYSNWSAGDTACDFIDKVESANGIWGEYAIEADYTQSAFSQGTLTNTTATSNTSPFTYAPNTSSPPVTTNTGDLELQRAGTKFTLTESVTSDFSSGTLTNMTASSNMLTPTTQQALEVQVQLPLSYGTNKTGEIFNTPPPVFLVEVVSSSAYAQIWSGSMTVASNDTLNYDIWISSTSPAFMAGIDILCSDGTKFSRQAEWAVPIGGVDAGEIGFWDQNSVSADILTDLSSYAKDTWYTRSIVIAGTGFPGAAGSNSLPTSFAGKTITSISVFCAGSSTGTYTFYVKNIYLGSQSGSPFLSTSASVTNVNPPVVTCTGGYIASTMRTTVVPVFLPASSSRVSTSHSISGVGLVQNSTIQWTASLPTLSAFNTLPTSALIPTATNTSSGGSQPAMVVQISYDSGTTWLTCVNQGALPGLPAGANVAGVSFLLKEYFSAGSDPSALPSLEQVQITINSAAAQSTTDVVATYGNATEWNTGTYTGLQVDGNGHLVAGGTYAPLWGSSSTAGQTFIETSSNTTQSVSSGIYTMSFATGGSTFLQGASRFDFAGDIQNGSIQCDIRIPTAGGMQAGIVYRTTCWELQSTNFMGYFVWFTADTGATFGAHLEIDYGTNSNVAGSATNLGTVGATGSPSFTFSANTWYTIKIIFVNNRHRIYANGTLILDLVDNTYLGGGGIGLVGNDNRNGTQTVQYRNCTVNALSGGEGSWQSANISLNALGTCGNTQIDWTEVNNSADVQSTVIVEASLDGGSTWQQCVNGAPIPQLPSGTSVSGKNLLLQTTLFTSDPLTAPILEALYVRVCGSYGTVSGTRVSPALSLTPVGYVAASNAAYHANIPTSTSVTVATSQDASTWTTVANSGAGASLGYWTNQPSATQDLFASNTSANYTNTSKSGGSAATATYDTNNSRITLAGGGSGLYLNNAINCADVDLLVDMDESDAGGLCWHVVSTSNYYELGVYDASSSGGFTNQLRLYKVSGGTRSLLGSASTVTFTRSTFHRVRVVMKGGLINIYWDGSCVQSYLDTSSLGAGQIGLRNDGGTSRYYQLWCQPLGTNLSGQVLYMKTTLTTSDPSQMPQVFTQLCCVRGPSIGTGATINPLHPVTLPFAAYLSAEMDTLTQASQDPLIPGGFYWYVDKWRQLRFGPRSARPGAFPLQSAIDPAQASGYLLYQPTMAQPVSVTNSADPLRNQQIITNVSGLVTPPPVALVADGNTTSWTLGYPVYSAPVILINGQAATVGLQGVDNGKQFYWQPNSTTINYDSSLPKLPSGTIINVTYVGQSTINVIQNNSAAIATQAALELNSGNIAEIESALTFSPNGTSSPNGMTSAQAQTFAQGLLNRFGNNSPSELIGTTLYGGLQPGTIIPAFVPELGLWNTQLPISKVTTTAFMGANGPVYLYTVDATSGANISSWQRVWF